MTIIHDRPLRDDEKRRLRQHVFESIQCDGWGNPDYSDDYDDDDDCGAEGWDNDCVAWV